MSADLELIACTPLPVEFDRFNTQAALPYGCTVDAIHAAMHDFAEFLGFVNQQLHTKQIARLETLMMPANFSSIVGEFMIAGIAKYCPTLVKNQYHNGHPDLIPADRFSGNAIQHTSEGIEIKASRYPSGWQGHNPEEVWLMVFVFESNRPADAAKSLSPKPFRFTEVVGAHLTKDDWLFTGRSETSRRTITASVAGTGYKKMVNNWIYRASEQR